jgi:integrase
MSDLVASTQVEAGALANAYAGRHVFDWYVTRRSQNTVRAQRADLDTFAVFLAQVAVDVTGEQLQTDPAAWAGMSWGLVEGFVRWLLGEGYAIASINRKLSTVKVYAGLAAKAGVLDAQTLTMIKQVASLSWQEAPRIDEKREVVRLGVKKEEAVLLTAAQAAALKTVVDSTEQALRDAVLMCLLLDHGLRVGELVRLKVADVKLASSLMLFYRPKVAKTQRHRLSADTASALAGYLAAISGEGLLLRRSNRSGRLLAEGMSERAITGRVRVLGERVGVEGLSAHDCRHFWATRAVKQGTDPFALLQAGGWTSMQTVKRYVDDQEVANEGVRLG